MSLNKSQALSVAKQYVLERNLRAAIEIYRQIIEADPSDLSAINTLGDLYITTGSVPEAIAQFSRVADIYIETGFTRKAIATLKKMISADPRNVENAIKLADMYAQAGLPSEARQHYLRISSAYSRKGETLEALRIFSKVVDLDPSNPSTRIKLGELYLSAGMEGQAFEAFVTAGEQLTDKGEIRRALNAYHEALSIRPDSPGASAAVSRLSTMLGADSDKVRASQTAVTGNLDGQNPSISAVLDLPAAPTAFPHRPDGSDDFVIQEISKAERLVAYGQVDQAISMLRNVLTTRPDNIDVHIKLKDVCLRTGMMAEAAQECGELARIYRASGERDRARDYAVRAERLTQLIEKPSGDLKQPERRIVAEPKPVELVEPRVSRAPIKLAPPLEPESKGQAITSQTSDVQVQSRIILSVVPPTTLSSEEAFSSEPTIVAEELPPSLQTDHIESSEALTGASLVSEYSSESAVSVESTLSPESEVQPKSQGSLESQVQAESPLLLESAVQAESVLSTESAASPFDQALSVPADTIAVILPTLTGMSLPVVKKRNRAFAARVGAACGAVCVAGALVGGFAYNAHLNKQYEGLTLSVAAVVEPFSPPPTVPDPEPTQEDQSLVVDVTPSSIDERPTQKETAARIPTAEPEPFKNEQPAQPQPTSEPLKVSAPPAPMPPRVSVNPDSQAYTESRTPPGLAGDVPISPGHPAEPPPKAVRRSAGVVPAMAMMRVDPVYPKAAREAQQSGVVTVEVMISEQGSVTSARALSGPILLRNAALSAARGWRFRPSMLGGVPVTTSSTITFNFKL